MSEVGIWLPFYVSFVYFISIVYSKLRYLSRIV